MLSPRAARIVSELDRVLRPNGAVGALDRKLAPPLLARFWRAASIAWWTSLAATLDCVETALGLPFDCVRTPQNVSLTAPRAGHGFDIVCAMLVGPHALTTYSGRQLDLDVCLPEAIFVEDIAAALSKICRFGAQAQRFYSVAQHAVLVRDIMAEDLQRPDLARFALHHDSHEAFAGDLPRPLKAKLNEEGGGVYKNLCDQLDVAIAHAFNFSIPAEGTDAYALFKRADSTALVLALLHESWRRDLRATTPQGRQPERARDQPRARRTVDAR